MAELNDREYLTQLLRDESTRRQGADTAHAQRLDRLESGQAAIAADVSALKTRFSGARGIGLMLALAFLTALGGMMPALYQALGTTPPAAIAAPASTR